MLYLSCRLYSYKIVLYCTCTYKSINQNFHSKGLKWCMMPSYYSLNKHLQETPIVPTVYFLRNQIIQDRGGLPPPPPQCYETYLYRWLWLSFWYGTVYPLWNRCRWSLYTIYPMHVLTWAFQCSIAAFFSHIIYFMFFVTRIKIKAA